MIAVRQNQEGEPFVVLVLQGDMELIQSQKTGNFYASARKCTISSTFSEQMAAAQVGKQLPGRIIREECEPYDFVMPECRKQEKSYTWVIGGPMFLMYLHNR